MASPLVSPSRPGFCAHAHAPALRRNAKHESRAFTAKHGQTRVDAERDSVRDAGRRAGVQGLVDELRVHAGAGDIEGEVL